MNFAHVFTQTAGIPSQDVLGVVASHFSRFESWWNIGMTYLPDEVGNVGIAEIRHVATAAHNANIFFSQRCRCARRNVFGFSSENLIEHGENTLRSFWTPSCDDSYQIRSNLRDETTKHGAISRAQSTNDGAFVLSVKNDWELTWHQRKV